MAITLSNVSLPAGSNSGTSPLSFAVTTSVGNLGIVAITFNTAVTISAVSDNLGQTYTSVGSQGADTTVAQKTQIYYKANSATGVTSISVTHTSTGISLMYCDCSSSSGGALDTSAALSTQNSANPAPTITAAAAGIAVVVLGTVNNAGSVAAPFTFRAVSTSGITNRAAGATDVNGAGGSLTATFTMTSGHWCSTIATFIESSTNVTVNPTGNSITASIGTSTITGTALVSPTGNLITSSVGTVTASAAITVSVTGNLLTSSVGTVSIVGSAVISPTGSQLTASIGTLTITGSALVSPTGNLLTSSVGTVNVSTGVIVSPTGNVLTSSVGTVSITGSASVSLTGNLITSTVGTVIVSGSALISPTGNQINSSVGTVVISGSTTVSVTGNSLSVTSGTVFVSGNANVIPGGSGLTISVGNVTVTVNGDVTVFVFGNSITSFTGDVSISGSANVNVTGNLLLASVGSINFGGPATPISLGVVVRDFGCTSDNPALLITNSTNEVLLGQPRLITSSIGVIQPIVHTVGTADNFGQMGEITFPGELLLPLGNGRLSSKILYLVAVGEIYCPLNAFSNDVTLTLHQNYFSGQTGSIVATEDPIAIGTASLSRNATSSFNLIAKLSGNGPTNGILISRYLGSINGGSFSGVLYSNRNPHVEPIIQLSLGFQFAGSPVNEYFQASIKQFQLQQLTTNRVLGYNGSVP